MSDTAGIEPLSAERVRAALSGRAKATLRALTVVREVDSTNSELARLPAEQRHGHAILADAQTNGRGRRQRVWHSPPGGNIYLSLGWRSGLQTAALSTLPLVVGLCLCRSLEKVGLRGHGVKWPNDILVRDAKLAGILVEMESPGSGPSVGIIGAGLNVRMPGNATGMPPLSIDQPWTDLASELPAKRGMIDRNAVAASLLDELLAGLAEFEGRGFEAFRNDWERFDLLKGRRVALQAVGSVHRGIVRGIDASGGLAVDLDDGGVQVYYAADVSLSHE